MSGPDKEQGPGRLVTWMVGLAVRVLPPGGSRERYEQEFLADLSGLPGRRQWAYALGVARAVLPLRFALERSSHVMWEAMVGARRRRPLLCLLRLRHRWVLRSTEDGGRYYSCTKCGKDRYSSSRQFAGGLPNG